MGILHEFQEEVEKLCDEVCQKYCKFHEEYEKKYGNTDEAWERLFDEKCLECPMCKM